MPTVKIPLVGVYQTRGPGDPYQNWLLGKDQKFSNCIFSLIKNPVTGKSFLYTSKRPGLESDTTYGAVNSGGANTLMCAGTTKYTRKNYWCNWNGTNTMTVYEGVVTTSVTIGTVTVTSLIWAEFSETLISGVTYAVFVINDNGTSACYYYPSNIVTSVVGDTHSNTTVDSLPTTVGLYVGQPITGTGIPANTRIASIDSGVAITLDTAATATNADVTFTLTKLVKITDTDFPTDAVGPMVFLDGYGFILTASGSIYQTNINTMASIGVNNYLSVNAFTDAGKGLAKIKNTLVAFGESSIEFFYNAGNPSGSVLSPIKQAVLRCGIPGNAQAFASFKRITQIGDDIYFWGVETNPETAFLISGRGDNHHVYKLSGFQLFRMSTPETAAFLQGIVPRKIEAFSVAGKNYLMITATSLATKCIVWDLDLDLPSEWVVAASAYMVNWHEAFSLGGSRFLTDDRTNIRGLYFTEGDAAVASKLDADASTGKAVTRIIQSIKVDFETTKRKFVTGATLVADKESTGTETVEYSDDDGANWVTWGTFDLTSMQPKLTRGGSFKGGRQFRLTNAAAVAGRASMIEIDYDVGTA